jgi:formylglycine-generating enzyme required for sulfatase activity
MTFLISKNAYLETAKPHPVNRIAYLLLFALTAHAQQNFSTYNQNIPGSSFSFTMTPIKAGSFLMGSPVRGKREMNETPQRNISISAFWMGAYEVTRDEFDIFLKDEHTSQNSDVDAITRPSPQYIDFSLGMGKEGGYPANSMSQYAALMYCRWLYQKTHIFYRLPTEAEWEYACRAGTSTTYFFGEDSTQLTKYAWYEKNSDNKFHKVGQKLPNAFGLYDILGNVNEWTLDHYTPNNYPTFAAKDPMIAANPVNYPKTVRGGDYTSTPYELRSTRRFHSDPIWNRRDPQIPKSKWWLTEAPFMGFRLVRPAKEMSEEEVNKFFAEYLGQ